MQATSDIEDMDKKRKDQFKAYEMEKEALRREKLKMMSDRERDEAQKQHDEMKKKQKEHPKVNHPVRSDSSPSSHLALFSILNINISGVCFRVVKIS